MRLTANEIHKLTLDPGVAERIVFDDDLHGFGIRLRAGGSRTFVFQYKLGAKHRRVSLGNAKAVAVGDARDTAVLLHARVKLGEDPAGEKAHARSKAVETFGAIVEQYLAARQSKLRQGSLGHVRHDLTVHARSLHGLRLDKVEKRNVAACVSAIKSKSGPIAANRARASISAFFTWAMGEGLAESNPVIGTNRSEEKARLRVLDNAELRLVWNALGDNQFGDIMRLLMLTGQRANEIAALRWSEIEGDAIKLPPERTKNGRAHVVPLSPAALAILTARPHGFEPDGSPRDFIFGRVSRKEFSGWAKCKRQLDEAVSETVGKPLPHWTVHDLRRSFTTHAAGIGIEPHILESILNHTSGFKGGIHGVYNKQQYEPQKRTALSIWADHLLGIVEGRDSNITPLKRA